MRDLLIEKVASILNESWEFPILPKGVKPSLDLLKQMVVESNRKPNIRQLEPGEYLKRMNEIVRSIQR